MAEGPWEATALTLPCLGNPRHVCGHPNWSLLLAIGAMLSMMEDDQVSERLATGHLLMWSSNPGNARLFGK